MIIYEEVTDSECSTIETRNLETFEMISSQTRGCYAEQTFS